MQPIRHATRFPGSTSEAPTPLAAGLADFVRELVAVMPIVIFALAVLAASKGTAQSRAARIGPDPTALN
jgi:hypothetical protein